MAELGIILLAVLSASLLTAWAAHFLFWRRVKIPLMWLRNELQEVAGNRYRFGSRPPSLGIFRTLVDDIEQIFSHIRQDLEAMAVQACLELSPCAPKKVPIVLGDLAKSIQVKFKERAHEALVVLTIELMPQLPPAMADRELLEFSLASLIDFLIDGSEPGAYISLNFFRQENQLSIRIRHTGVGEEAPFIKHLDRRLVLVKNIIRAHGSQLHIEVIPGQALKMHFELEFFGGLSESFEAKF